MWSRSAPNDRIWAGEPSHLACFRFGSHNQRRDFNGDCSAGLRLGAGRVPLGGIDFCGAQLRLGNWFA